MGRALPAVIATKGLLAVAAPAISGAAQRPGKPLSRRAPVLLTSDQGLIRHAGHASVKVRRSNQPGTDGATTLTASTAAALTRLPQQTGKR
jgi:hypothetical protein